MKTTIAQILLNEKLPDDLRVDGRIDKKRMNTLLSDIAQKYPERYDELANHVKDVGNQAAYEGGTSFDLGSLAPMIALRDRAFAAHASARKALIREALANPGIQHHPDFLARRAKVHAAIEHDVNEAVKQHINTAPNRVTGWVASGARGDASMARQMLAMSGLNTDVAGNLAPDIARNSFSEGLSPVDFHIHAMGARRGVVNTYTSVREPGAFAKELNALTADMLITQHDCGAQGGRTLSTRDPDTHDRLLAQDLPGIGHRNEVITPAMRQRMLGKGLDQVQVRSPLTCRAKEGVCAHDYGLNEEGRLPQIGDHVGLRASGALTEPLTQLALNTKHTGGVIGAGKSPFRQIMDLMRAPKELLGSAVLARHAGTVTRLVQAPSGGHVLHVDKTPHYLAPEIKPLVQLGHTVERGQTLSSGALHPADVVELRGMEHGREHFADSLRQLYGDAGIRGHGKVFETVSRAVLNLGQVVEPGESGHIPGEIVHWNTVMDHMRGAKHEAMPVGQAEGRILARPTGTLAPFTVMTNRHAADLLGQGIKQVHVFEPNQLVVKPIMLGTERAAIHKGDWLANLGYRFIGQTLKENAATGAVADLHGYNPIGPYAYGAEFGKGEGGRY